MPPIRARKLAALRAWDLDKIASVGGDRFHHHNVMIQAVNPEMAALVLTTIVDHVRATFGRMLIVTASNSNDRSPSLLRSLYPDVECVDFTNATADSFLEDQRIRIEAQQQQQAVAPIDEDESNDTSVLVLLDMMPPLAAAARNSTWGARVWNTGRHYKLGIVAMTLLDARPSPVARQNADWIVIAPDACRVLAHNKSELKKCYLEWFSALGTIAAFQKLVAGNLPSNATRCLVSCQHARIHKVEDRVLHYDLSTAYKVPEACACIQRFPACLPRCWDRVQPPPCNPREAIWFHCEPSSLVDYRVGVSEHLMIDAHLPPVLVEIVQRYIEPITLTQLSQFAGTTPRSSYFFGDDDK